MYGCGPKASEQANQNSNKEENHFSAAFDSLALSQDLILGPELRQAVKTLIKNTKGIGLIWHHENLYLLAVDSGIRTERNDKAIAYCSACVLIDDENKPYWDIHLLGIVSGEVGNPELPFKLIKPTAENSGE